MTISRPGYASATKTSAATARISNLPAKTISMELNDYSVKRGQRVYAEIELLARGESWSIFLDGMKLASGFADAEGVARTSFVIPTGAVRGERVLTAYGQFRDRNDPDKINVR